MTLLLRQIGPLRLMLFSLAVLIILLAPSGDSGETREGWALVPTVLIPALTPMVLMALLLDALMNRVWMVDATTSDRPRFRRVMWLNLAIGTAMIIAFIPYLQSLSPG